MALFDIVENSDDVFVQNADMLVSSKFIFKFVSFFLFQ